MTDIQFFAMVFAILVVGIGAFLIIEVRRTNRRLDRFEEKLSKFGEVGGTKELLRLLSRIDFNTGSWAHGRDMELHELVAKIKADLSHIEFNTRRQ